MRVKLCARCPYTPRDLADQYDADAALYLCPACDLEHDRRKSQRRRTCPTTTTNTTGTAEQHAAPFAKEGSASFAIIAAAPPCVPENASSISRAGVRTTAAGYGDFARPEDDSDRERSSWRSTSPDEVPAC
jgi:hypothetical protein